MEIEEKSFKTSFFYWIGVLEKLANAKFVEEMGAGKSIVARWRTLSILAEKEQATITELAEETFIERSALSRLLDSMEEEGLLARRLRVNDRRTTEIFLTDAGRSTFSTMLPIRRAIFKQASRGLSSDEVAELMRIIHVLVANLQEDLDA